MATSRHILATYRNATSAERAEGRRWYDDARALAANLAHTPDHRPGVTLAQSAGVIAALSPLTPWNRNKELALLAVTNHKASQTLGNSVRAADAILNGSDPLTVLKGDKVRNFYLSILGDSDAVTIDRHALEVYQGRRYRDADRPAVGKRLYREASEAYRRAARTLNRTDPDAAHDPLTASQLQAITWVAWRRIHLTDTRYAVVL